VLLFTGSIGLGNIYGIMPYRVDTVILCSIVVWVDILSIGQLTVFDCIRCISSCYWVCLLCIRVVCMNIARIRLLLYIAHIGVLAWYWIIPSAGLLVLDVCYDALAWYCVY
jgi:hypothetical protein